MDSFEEKLKSLLEAADIENVEFTQWAFTDNDQKDSHVMSVSEFCSEFVKIMVAFKTHNFISKKQSSFTYQLKKNLPDYNALILMDFAENYSIKTQNEVQNAYFRKKQISILTIYVYMQVGDQLKEQSYVALTDDVRHAKTATVYTSYRKLQAILDDKFPQRVFSYILSDGCAGQFKNRKQFTTISYHEADFGHKCAWIFSASGHGKSVVDGIGGTVKRLASEESIRSQFDHSITSAKGFHDFMIRKNLKTIPFIITTEEIDNVESELNQRFSNAIQVKGTQKFHHFTTCPTNSNYLLVKPFSESKNTSRVKINKK